MFTTLEWKTYLTYYTYTRNSKKVTIIKLEYNYI